MNRRVARGTKTDPPDAVPSLLPGAVMRLTGATLWAFTGTMIFGCGSSSPPPPPAQAQAADGNAAERAAVRQVLQTMQAKNDRMKAAWQQSVTEGKTPAPTDFFFVEVASLQEADLTGCPADFRESFQALVRSRQRQLRAAETYKGEVPGWDAWTLIERKGDAPDAPPHEREIAAAARHGDAAWQNLGAVCARYK